MRGSLIAALAWSVACGSDSGTGPNNGPPIPTTPDGNYTIATVNGKALPVALLADGGFKREVTVGSLSLTTAGKYSIVTTYRETIPGNVTTYVDSTGGTWVLVGTSVNFTDDQDGSTGQGTWANNQLKFDLVDGKVTTTYIYARK